MFRAKLLLTLGLVVTTTLLPGSASADHGNCWGEYYCCVAYGEHAGYPKSSTGTSWSATPILGGRGDASATYASPSASFDVGSYARGTRGRTYSGVALVDQQTMGEGRAAATATKSVQTCQYDKATRVTTTFQSLAAEGALQYAQAGEAIDSWVEVRAYYYIIRCRPGGYGGYYSCTRDEDVASTAYSRVACTNGYSTPCTTPSSVTLTSNINDNQCPFYPQSYCTGVYATVTVTASSYARGEVETTAAARGSIGQLY